MEWLKRLTFWGVTGCLIGSAVAAQAAAEVVQLVVGEPLRRHYPAGLSTLLEVVSQETALDFATEPRLIRAFDDPALREAAVVYVNAADRPDWQLASGEVRALRDYLQRGGFLIIDAGVTASFLRGRNAGYAQSHSFAEWEVAPEIAEAFAEVFPENRFEPLPRDHPLFRMFYAGLPPADDLPETTRDFVIHEKWPQGTYSLLALTVDGRVAAVASPILAMGWGRDQLGRWNSNIGFRIRESAEGLDARLAEAAYQGERFETVREDGRKDVIFTQEAATPAWVQEPDGRWRVFRYYFGPEINDYAHRFYTRLGVNLLLYGLTQ